VDCRHGRVQDFRPWITREIRDRGEGARRCGLRLHLVEDLQSLSVAVLPLGSSTIGPYRPSAGCTGYRERPVVGEELGMEVWEEKAPGVDATEEGGERAVRGR
jgi:hypothetical protein